MIRESATISRALRTFRAASASFEATYCPARLWRELYPYPSSVPRVSGSLCAHALGALARVERRDFHDRPTSAVKVLA